MHALHFTFQSHHLIGLFLEWLIIFVSMYYFFYLFLILFFFFSVSSSPSSAFSLFHLLLFAPSIFPPDTMCLHGSAVPPPMHYGVSWPSPSLNCLGWKNTSTPGWQFLPAGDGSQTGASATYSGRYHTLTVQPHTNPAAAETFPRPRLHPQYHWQCLFRTAEDIWGPKWQVDSLPSKHITASATETCQPERI